MGVLWLIKAFPFSLFFFLLSQSLKNMQHSYRGIERPPVAVRSLREINSQLRRVCCYFVWISISWPARLSVLNVSGNTIFIHFPNSQDESEPCTLSWKAEIQKKGRINLLLYWKLEARMKQICTDRHVFLHFSSAHSLFMDVVFFKCSVTHIE